MHLAAWLCSRIIFICRDRGDFSGGLLPVLPVCRRDRAERVRRGAGNRCYVQFLSIDKLTSTLRLTLFINSLYTRLHTRLDIRV